MSVVDLFFLAAFIACLGALLLGSPIIRAIAWDTLRHPFTRATILVNEDRIEVRHDLPADKAATLSS